MSALSTAQRQENEVQSGPSEVVQAGELRMTPKGKMIVGFTSAAVAALIAVGLHSGYVRGERVQAGKQEIFDAKAAWVASGSNDAGSLAAALRASLAKAESALNDEGREELKSFAQTVAIAGNTAFALEFIAKENDLNVAAR